MRSGPGFDQISELYEFSRFTFKCNAYESG